ncbi:DNA polymerase epsilon subunit B [Verticillium dahliae VDG2]|nr:DNA polymerase epsilon subunit B [Verticillium dahliae VDG2]
MATEGHTLAEREARGLKGGIIAIVYIACGLATQKGVSILEAGGGEWFSLQFHDVKENTLPLKLEAVATAFYNDIEDGFRDGAVALLSEQSKRPFTDVVDFLASDLEIPKIYVVCKNDNAVPFAFQQFMAQASGAEIVELDCGHSPFLREEERRQIVDLIIGVSHASGRHVIKVQGRITITPFGKEVRVSSDKTIVGIGSTGQIYQGGFAIHGVRNVIIRNLKIGNTPMTTENDYDGIQSDTTSNIWIDHCLLENGGDGLLILRKDTTFFTVSNNIFRNHDKAFGIGWTENVVARGTIHHNWFDRTNQRNPSADNLAQCHLYNNYVLGVTSYGHYARGSTNARVENVYFESCRNPLTKDSGAILNASGNIYQSCTGTVAANSGTAFQPRDYYSCTLPAPADVPSHVKANAGPRASVCPS